MKLSDERARELALAAIAFEVAKEKARLALVDERRHRIWRDRSYEYVTSEEEWKRSSMALYSARESRDCLRRAYQRQLRYALLENVE